MVTDESVTESTARRVGGLVTAEEMKVGKRRNCDTEPWQSTCDKVSRNATRNASRSSRPC